MKGAGMKAEKRKIFRTQASLKVVLPFASRSG